MTFTSLSRSWHSVYCCFVNQCSRNTPKSIMKMAKCAFASQNSVGYEVEGRSASESEVSPADEDRKKTFLVVGLGNCDQLDTRHSIGMHILDRISGHFKLRWEKDDFRKSGGFVARTHLPSGVNLILLKPRVPMSINGISVAKAVRHYQILSDNLYIIHDDLDLPIGKFQLKESGSAGGHNGVKSVMHSMRTKDLKRLRIGIDRPSSQDMIVEYVLSRFSYDQELALLPVIASSVSSLFQHIGQQCGVELDIKLKTDPSKSPQWSGVRITKPHREKQYRQNKWDRESKHERPDFDNRSNNWKKYGNSRMSKWEENDDDFSRQRRTPQSDGFGEFRRNDKNFRSDLDEYDFSRQRRTPKTDDFEDFRRNNNNSRSDLDEYDFPRQRSFRSSSFEDFPEHKRSPKSNKFFDFDDALIHRRFSKSGDLYKFEDASEDDGEFVDSRQKKQQDTDWRDLSVKRES